MQSFGHAKKGLGEPGAIWRLKITWKSLLMTRSSHFSTFFPLFLPLTKTKGMVRVGPQQYISCSSLSSTGPAVVCFTFWNDVFA